MEIGGNQRLRKFFNKYDLLYTNEKKKFKFETHCSRYYREMLKAEYLGLQPPIPPTLELGK